MPFLILLYVEGKIETEAKTWLDMVYTPKKLQLKKDLIQALWNYNTNLDDKDTERNYMKALQEVHKYGKESWKNHITKYNFTSFKSSKLKERFQSLSVSEKPALDDETFSEFISIQSFMKKTYGTGKVCPLNKRTCKKETEGFDQQKQPQ